MEKKDIIHEIEVYILEHEKCGKCSNIQYLGGNRPFICSDGTLLLKYVNLNFMSNCSKFSRRTNNSVVIPDFDKEFELYCRILK